MDDTLGNPGDELKIIRAQAKIRKLYDRIGRKGGWRAVRDHLQKKLKPEKPGKLAPQLNVSYIANLMNHGTIPPRKYRPALFLPRVMPSERRAYIKKIVPGLLDLDEYFTQAKWRKK